MGYAKVTRTSSCVSCGLVCCLAVSRSRQTCAVIAAKDLLEFPTLSPLLQQGPPFVEAICCCCTSLSSVSSGFNTASQVDPATTRRFSKRSLAGICDPFPAVPHANGQDSYFP